MTQEMYLILFTCLSCLAAGIFLAVALADKRDYPEQVLFWGSISSLVALGLGGISAILNLGHPEMVLGALAHPGTGIFFEFLSILLFGVAVLIYVFMLVRGMAESSRRILAYVSAFFALALLVAFGRNFYMEWRPAWNTYTLAVPFLGWGLAVAGYTYGIFSRFSDEENLQTMWPALMGSCIALIFTLSYFCALILSPAEEAQAAVQSCLSGAYMGHFWGGIIICGFVIPVIAALITKAKVLWVNALCILFSLIGAGTLQWLLFQLGTATWQFFKKMG
ncbi:MAG: PAM68 family protein [Burkholderiales bacterium]|nr:PAM68 family protein [Burkholderiales bacterium]